MKAIIYGVGTFPLKWEAARRAYGNMVVEEHQDCAYTFRSGVKVHAKRGKHSITITVQPDEEASK